MDQPNLSQLSSSPIIQVKNAGQKQIYLIRQAYLQGSLVSGNNPSANIQFILNKPIEIDPKLYHADPKDRAFLQAIIAKIQDGTIHLFTPATLLNQEIYEQAAPDIQAKADYDILTLLYKIRQIKQLWDTGERESYQIMNITNALRLAKESLESAQGDIFII